MLPEAIFATTGCGRGSSRGAGCGLCFERFAFRSACADGGRRAHRDDSTDQRPDSDHNSGSYGDRNSHSCSDRNSGSYGDRNRRTDAVAWAHPIC
ncbi:MAG: hypothetical protein OXH29_06410 [bacterium]|nr:hypothetical protein [bacterium]